MKPQQKIRPLGLRAKILGIIAVAVVFPLVAGTLITRFLGYRAYRNEKGSLFQAVAVHYAKNINDQLEGHARSLQEWATLSRLPSVLAKMTRGSAPDVEELNAEVEYWESRWPKPGQDTAPILPFLTNEAANLIRTFQALNPRFVEVLVTDADGRLVAASGATEDYWQADEKWWQEALALDGSQVLLEGIHEDSSAGVRSVDMSLAILDPADRRRPLGVVKVVLEAAPVIGSFQPLLGQDQPISEAVLEDGRVLVRRFDHGGAPRARVVTNDVMRIMAVQGVGWGVLSLAGTAEELVGFAGTRQVRPFGGRIRFAPRRWHEVYVIVHEDLGSVLEPIHRQLRILTSVGGLLMLVFGLAGIIMATRRIISPLQMLRAAANSISATARLAEDDEGYEEPGEASEELARDMVERVGTIDTGDEIEDLAVEFRRMADRVLNYHVQLQSELTEKTEEVQRDLAIAREFQEALLPKTYPDVPAPGVEAPLSLGFAHRYRAALSVGGDFFYVTRLSDFRAAVFITDVMGHGTRSALVTAILRTLLHNLEPGLEDAGSIMSYINRQFCQSVPHGKEFIFATAFCLVIDTATGEATGASAGHPSALRGARGQNDVVPVLANREVGMALGLAKEAVYTPRRLRLEPGDLFLLYTDGIIEAPNLINEEFGERRLRAVIASRREADADAVCDAVMQAVARHMDTVVAPDDLCMAAVSVKARRGADGRA